jgi:hypothetical protein
MQHHPSTRSVHGSTVPDENEATLVETTDGLMIAPRWLAELIERVTARPLTRAQARHLPRPTHPSLWDVTS